MKVQNMKGKTGRSIPNQFIINEAHFQMPEDTYEGQAFQSYQSIIALKAFHCGNTGNTYKVFLDINKWDYSTTTGKYRNQFLGETKSETENKIKTGLYKLVDLN